MRLRLGAFVAPLADRTLGHARIVVTNGQPTIEDLGSKNGTSVDGRQVKKPVALEEGAQVRVGSVTMTYRTLDALPSTLTQRRR